MTDEEARILQRQNAKQLARMDIAAAGMIQSLLLDLGSNDTYIRLKSAQAHSVDYEFIEGTLEYIEEIGAELGLTVAGATIEVPHE